MSIGCIIQARMGSTRLPGKVMMKVDEVYPVLFYVITQLQNCKHIDKIVVATTTLKEDDVIVDYVNEIGMDFFRGNPDDVLDRYYQCAKKFSFSTIVRITSDNPLIDPEIVDLVIEKFTANQYDYITNSLPRTFPYGTETEVFSFTSLEKAWLEAEKPSEREHVTPYLYNHPNKFTIYNVQHNENISHLRWTVDRENDLKLVRTMVSKIKKRPILMKDILDLISKEPKLLEINKDYVKDEGYLKSLKADEEFLKLKNKQ